MCGFAEAAIVLGDPEYAGPLFDQLAPWAGQWCTKGITSQGPVSHYIGGPAAVLCRLAEADAYFAQSATMCDRARAKFSPPGQTSHGGKMLAERSAPGDVEKARVLLTKAHTAAAANRYGNVKRRASTALRLLDQ